MKYFIFIDESGSLNNKGEGYFSVSGVIFPEEYFSKIKNWCKRNFNKARKLASFSYNTELKASKLRSAKTLGFLYEFYNEIQQVAKILCIYFNNKNINKKWLEDKNATFNFMIKKLIIKAITLGFIKTHDEIQIIADKRHESIKYFWSIEQYLNKMFVDKNLLKSLIFSYINSKNSWEITIADWISFINYRKIQTPLKDRTQFVELF